MKKIIMGALALILALCMVAIPTLTDDSDQNNVDVPVLASSVSESKFTYSTGEVTISVSDYTVTLSVYAVNMWKQLHVDWGDGQTYETSELVKDNTATATHTYASTGNYTLSFTYTPVTNLQGPLPASSDSTRVSITGSEGELNFSTPPTLEAVSGSRFSYTPSVNITGSTITKQSGSSWLTISSGRLTGTAPSVSSEQSYSVVLKAVSPGGQEKTQTITVDVYPVAQITASSRSINATVGTAISAVTLSSNLAGNYAISSGSLPDGLSLSSSGRITGTPTESGTFTVTVRQTVTEGPTQRPTVSLTLNVAGSDFSITSTAPTKTFVTSSLYTYNLTASESDVTWTIENAPDWLVVSGNSVTGTVPPLSDATTVSYTVKAISDGVEKSQAVTIKVEPKLEYTTIPTASMIIIPVYNYSPDGTPNLSSFAGDVKSLFNSEDSGIKIENTSATFKFVYTGEGATSLLWDFGDGTTSEDWTAVHTYEKSGTYTIKLKATNETGTTECTHELTVNLGDSDSPNYLLYALIGIIVLLVLYVIISRNKCRHKPVRKR